MKKTAIIVIVMLIAMFFVTCDEFFPNESKVEYTDVEYSEDGSRVTIYLDGVGVPVTAAQRAMSTRLSKMAYDYLDVVFKSGSVIARAQWELGQAAGISGVDRGTTGVAYPQTAAVLVAGLKNGKTLLGIGKIIEIDNVATTTFMILPKTTSVTFEVEAVKTGLLVDGEPTDGTAYGGIKLNSMGTWGDSSRTKLGSAEYPTYPLPLPVFTATPSPGAWTTKTGNYEFFGAPVSFAAQLTYASATAAKVFVEPRFPRYMDNGRYRQLSATIDMLSEVKVTTQPTTTFVNPVPLTFTPKGSGIFSFYIEIPVYVLSSGGAVAAEQGTNAGKLMPIKWNIRTGLGSELYSLDDGAAGGGCVLMTIGVLDLEDWLEIQWIWKED